MSCIFTIWPSARLVSLDFLPVFLTRAAAAYLLTCLPPLVSFLFGLPFRPPCLISVVSFVCHALTYLTAWRLFGPGRLANLNPLVASLGTMIPVILCPITVTSGGDSGGRSPVVVFAVVRQVGRASHRCGSGFNMSSR